MKVIGILGGMGPEASLDFERDIFELTPATNDQENFKVLHFSNPNLPDRTAAFKNINQNPALAKTIIKGILESIDLFLSLKKFECNVLAIPCNTVSYFFNDIKIKGEQDIKGVNSYLKGKRLPFKILNPVEEMAKFVSNNIPADKNIGLLSTSATLETGLYQREFRRIKRKIVTVDKNTQEMYVSPAITLIKKRKKREAKKILEPAVKFLENKEADFTILGCTELPLVLKGKKFLSSTLILARATILNMLELI